ILVVGIDDEILNQIYKFSFPIQQLIINEALEIELPRKTETEKAAENKCLIVSKLIKRSRNAYWRIEDKGSPEEKSEFIKDLKDSLEIILKK
ncbi:22313_t:CDS:2, partial [Gigaspora margarita]